MGVEILNSTPVISTKGDKMKTKKNKKINVLVFNCGSSSLKYKLIFMPEEKLICGGEAQRIGPKTVEPARIIHKENGKEEILQVEMKDHGEAFSEILKILSRNKENIPDVLGHRVVHGADIFKNHCIIHKKEIEDLKKTLQLAPIHNPPAFSLIESCHKLYPDLPQVAVFDTAFHSTIPEYAKIYAIPLWIRQKFGIKKFGFHGTSHRFVMEETCKLLKIEKEKFNGVSCHLGSGGASLCAIVNGKSVDNTMGFTPLPGLVMSTRCGDIDPAITLRIAGLLKGNIKETENILNKKSGVLGMSGISADIRDIIKEASMGNKLAKQVFDIYIWRLKKTLGAYLAIVEKTDAIIFTDTIGEIVPEVRREVLAGMEVFGIQVDYEKNMKANNYKELPIDFATNNSKVRLVAIATNEELAIARVTASLVA